MMLHLGSRNIQLTYREKVQTSRFKTWDNCCKFLALRLKQRILVEDTNTKSILIFLWHRNLDTIRLALK
jgi:hypothetical protein